MDERGKMKRFANAVIRVIPTPWIEFASRNQYRIPVLRPIFAWGASWVKNQDSVVLHGVGQGLRFNASASHSGFILGHHEPEVQKLLAEFLKPGMVCYDAGANVGFFAAIAARLVGPSGTVVCFEPLPDNAHQIAHNIQLNGFRNVVIRPEALGGSNRTETFHTSAEPTWGTLSSVGKLPDHASDRILVQVATLDSLLEDGGLAGPDLVKIDIEGAEAEALRGAAATLKRYCPLLIIELHGTNDAVLRVLDEFGYDAAVLGSSTSVHDVTWDANIVAAPRLRADLMKYVRRFSESSVVK